jgi:hypothetical protein
MLRKLPACDRARNRRLDVRSAVAAAVPGPPVLFGKNIRNGEACCEPILLTYFHSDLQHRNQLRERTPR